MRRTFSKCCQTGMAARPAGRKEGGLLECYFNYWKTFHTLDILILPEVEKQHRLLGMRTLISNLPVDRHPLIRFLHFSTRNNFRCVTSCSAADGPSPPSSSGSAATPRPPSPTPALCPAERYALLSPARRMRPSAGFDKPASLKISLYSMISSSSLSCWSITRGTYARL